MHDSARATRLKERARLKRDSACSLLTALSNDLQVTQVMRFMRGLESVESALRTEIDWNDWTAEEEAIWLNGAELSLRIAELGLQSLERRLMSGDVTLSPAGVLTA